MSIYTFANVGVKWRAICQAKWCSVDDGLASIKGHFEQAFNLYLPTVRGEEVQVSAATHACHALSASYLKMNATESRHFR